MFGKKISYSETCPRAKQRQQPVRTRQFTGEKLTTKPRNERKTVRELKPVGHKITSPRRFINTGNNKEDIRK